MNDRRTLHRRTFLRSLAATGAAALVGPAIGAEAVQPLTRPIPSSGERLPVIGLGTWITFNVGDDPVLRDECAAVVGAFFKAGGRMIDSSPMYSSSQPVIGYALRKLGEPAGLFSADKVWTNGDGAAQIAQSLDYWGIPRFDLLQVHNLLSWKEHLLQLFAMKAAGRLGYVGITTSEGRRHDEFERIMRDHPLDFIQVTYNILDREVEARILPLAAERGMAVIANRPFRQGALIAGLEGYSLPPFAAEIGCANWPQFLLKFIVSHPALTVAIPATSRVDHLAENMGAAEGPMPDEAMRARMIAYVESL